MNETRSVTKPYNIISQYCIFHVSAHRIISTQSDQNEKSKPKLNALSPRLYSFGPLKKHLREMKCFKSRTLLT